MINLRFNFYFILFKHLIFVYRMKRYFHLFIAHQIIDTYLSLNNFCYIFIIIYDI